MGKLIKLKHISFIYVESFLSEFSRLCSEDAREIKLSAWKRITSNDAVQRRSNRSNFEIENFHITTYSFRLSNRICVVHTD